MVEEFPRYNSKGNYPKAVKDIEPIKEIIKAVRTIKVNVGAAPSKKVPLYVLSENNGEIKNKYEFEKKNANKMSIGSAGCAIAFSDNKGKVSTTLLVFNANGDAIYSGVIDGGISDMEYIEGSVFVTRSDTVTKIDIKSGKLTEIQTYEKGTDIIVYDENNILLC
jgi:valyl-tRNA synthetase